MGRCKNCLWDARYVWTFRDYPDQLTRNVYKLRFFQHHAPSPGSAPISHWLWCPIARLPFDPHVTFWLACARCWMVYIRCTNTLIVLTKPQNELQFGPLIQFQVLFGDGEIDNFTCSMLQVNLISHNPQMPLNLDYHWNSSCSPRWRYLASAHAFWVSASSAWPQWCLSRTTRKSAGKRF